MEELIRNKIRTYGAVCVILFSFLMIILFLFQFKEKSLTALKLRILNADIAQTTNSAIRDNGFFSEWGLKEGYKNADILEMYFFKYFKIEKNCIHEANGCNPTGTYKSIKFRNTKINLNDIPTITTKNNTSISVEIIGSCQKENEICANVFVDLNGADEPNALGKDLFLFVLQNNKHQPFATYGEELAVEELKKNKQTGCNTSADRALYCAALIKKNNWIITPGYPW